MSNARFEPGIRQAELYLVSNTGEKIRITLWVVLPQVKLQAKILPSV